MKKHDWLQMGLITGSYVMVAAAAAFVTLIFCWQQPTKLTQLEAVVKEKFIDEVDLTQAEDAAAEAYVEALGDRWSYYIPAAEYARHQERKTNSYVGIGVTIEPELQEDGYRIVRVEPGGPAKAAGILPEDVITAVEGQSASELDLEQMGDKIRGKAGTQVKLTVTRQGKPMELTVMRETIARVVASGQMLEGNVGLVTIANFNTNCAAETIRASQQLIQDGAEALIFDVRNNGGGYVTEMIKILDFLLPEGDLFRSVDYKGKEKVEVSDPDCVDLPIAVLINGSSYSAAEFFAAALNEYDRAVLVGEDTTGKGHFQYTLPLNDGSAVNLSVGWYKTPKGVDLEKTGGLKAELPVPVDEKTGALIYAHAVEPREDPQIQAAVKALKKP